MKIYVWMMSLVLAAALAGCAEQADPAGAAGSGLASGTAVAFGAGQAAEVLELTEEEILSAYDRAVTAYAWFDLETLSTAGPAVWEGDVRYLPVDYPGMETLSDLRAYLRGLFSQDVVARLLPEDAAEPIYRDIDGALHVHPAQRWADPAKGAIVTAVAQEDADTYLINVTVELLDSDLSTKTGVECYAFPYEFSGGRWVFTQFSLVY